MRIDIVFSIIKYLILGYKRRASSSHDFMYLSINNTLIYKRMRIIFIIIIIAVNCSEYG